MYTLLILTLKSILSSVIASSFYRSFQTKNFGIWFQDKLKQLMSYLSDKYDIELAKKEAKWRQDYPLLSARIDKMDKRIKELENGKKTS